MKITFKGVPGEQHESVYMYGQNFPLNKAVTVTNPMAIRKLSEHPHFEAKAEAADEAEDARIRAEFEAAANARLSQAQADAAPPAPTPAPEAPPAPPAEPTHDPVPSALAYQETFEKASAAQAGGMPETVKSAQEYQDIELKGGNYANADAERAGNPDPAQDRVSGPKGNRGSGRSVKGS